MMAKTAQVRTSTAQEMSGALHAAQRIALGPTSTARFAGPFTMGEAPRGLGGAHGLGGLGQAAAFEGTDEGSLEDIQAALLARAGTLAAAGAPAGPPEGPPGPQGFRFGDVAIHAIHGEGPWAQRACAACPSSDEQEPLQRQVDGSAPVALVSRQADDEAAQGSSGEADASLPEAQQELGQRACAKCDEGDELRRKERSADPPNTDVADTIEVGAPDDRYEREADRVAEIVTAEPARPSAAAAAPAPAPMSAVAVVQTQDGDKQGDGADVQDEDEQGVEAKELGDAPSTTDTPAPPDDQDKDEEIQCRPAARPAAPERRAPAREPIAHLLRRTRGAGAPLPGATRQHMEARFGLDFGAVRVHTDARAAEMNARLSALAFTSGHDLYFGPGQWRPGTREGDRLLAHELTHVVQQSGGAPATAIQTKVPGSVAHAEAQKRLIKANDNLMVEVPIPGATRLVKKLTKVGFADLWFSDGNLTPDTRARVKGGVQEFTSLTKTQRGKLAPQGRAVWSPAKGAGGWSGTFPDNFHVSDLKPMSWELLGGGLLQIDNYKTGLAEFAKAFNAANPSSKTTPTGHTMTTLNIPAALNYDNFDTELGTAGPDSYVVGGERMWLYDTKKGLVVYFFIDANYKSHQAADLKRQQEELIEVEKLKKSLLEPGNAIDKGNVVTPKLRPGISPVRRGSLRRLSRGRPLAVQRQGGGTPTPAKPKVDWAKRAKEWEDARAKWAGPARAWMRGEGKAHAHKMKIDSRLGIHKPPPGKVAGDQVKEFRSIRFWSSPFGLLAGKVRFALGRAFDFVIEKFEKIKKRFQGWYAKAAGHADTGYGFGWRKTLIKLIFKAIKFGIKKFLIESFGIFADCASALMDKAVSSVVDELKETFKDEICFLQKAWEDFKDKLESTFESIFGVKYDEVLKTLSEAKEWLDLVLTLEALIRTGLQVVSCLSPPALGCLWGLVGQVTLEVALDLIMGTKWFEDNILGSADVRKVIKRFLGREYQKVMDKLIESVGLTKLADGVGACHIDTELDESKYFEGGLSDSDFQKQRAEWEKKYGAQMLTELQALFKNAKGQPATAKELEELLAAVDKARKSGLSFEDIRKIIDAGRPGKGKPISLPHALGGLTGVGAPQGDAATTPTTSQPPGSGGTPPASAAQTPGGGGGGGDTDAGTGSGGGGIPVYDATKLPPAPTLGETGGGAYAVLKGNHTVDAYKVVEISADLYDNTTKKQYATMSHVRVTVPKRTYHPNAGDEKTATHINIHYKLVDGFMSPPPHADTGWKAGRLVHGYVRYRFVAPK